MVEMRGDADGSSHPSTSLANPDQNIADGVSRQRGVPAARAEPLHVRDNEMLRKRCRRYRQHLTKNATMKSVPCHAIHALRAVRAGTLAFRTDRSRQLSSSKQELATGNCFY